MQRLILLVWLCYTGVYPETLDNTFKLSFVIVVVGVFISEAATGGVL